MSCRGFLQCLLKLLNLVLTIVGAVMVLYGLWMLKQWHQRDIPDSSPTPAPTDESYESFAKFVGSAADAVNLPTLSLQTEMLDGQVIQQVGGLSFVLEPATKLHFSAFPDGLPSPWFIYAFLGAGILALLTTCIGHIAAETSTSCCLCCYTLLLGLLLILQAVFTAVIFFDNTWKEDIPKDPTGELEKIYSFIAHNYDICKWTGLTVLIIEVLALLFSLILRSVLDPRNSGYDSDDDYLPRTQRQPAVNRQATTAGNGAPGDAPAETRPPRTDEWSKRLREKYGFDTNEFTYDPSESRRFAPLGGTAAPAEEKKSGCTIL